MVSTITTSVQNREAWLHSSMPTLRRYFAERGYTIPDNVRIGVGWPSKKGTSEKNRAIGEAWSYECSGDNSHEVIISVWLDDPIRVLGTLVHELIHVTVGVEHGHRKPFKTAMKALGLEGKATHTTESPELSAFLQTIVDDIGPYPHARLSAASTTRKQGTRMLKLECSACGAIVRTTAKWLEEYGTDWPCPCGGVLSAEPPDESPED